MPPFRTLARSFLATLLVTAVTLSARPASAVKVMTYNLLNYPSASGAAREDEFRTIFTAVHPDVVISQEITGTTDVGMNQFVSNVLNSIYPGEYVAGPWIHGNDTNNVLYYRTAVFDFVSADTIGTPLRAIHHFVLRLDGYAATGGELHLYSAHLKASATQADQDQRTDECTRWRNRANLLPAGTNFLGGGDFNMRSSSETAYGVLTGSQADNDGRFFDPINTPGTWNNNSSFALIHSQSPMGTNSYGGATGGIDDRFDILLASSSLMDAEGMSYVASTYRTYGNDGQHFNLTIDAAPTIPEGAAMATALAGASDHMPVILELQVPAKVNTLASLPFGSVIVGATAAQNLTVSNAAVAPADELTYTLVAPVGFTVPGGGPFAANAGAAANNHSIGMLTASAGVKAGNLTVNSDDVDSPATTVALSGTVLDHAVPSVQAALPAVLAGSVDFGTHNVGGFTDQPAEVHNAGYGSLQARLDVYGAAITGPDAARFSIAGGFNPALVSGTPASWNVHFDDTGATAATYTATLTFQNRDESLPGAVNQSDVVYSLQAIVSGQSGVPDAGSAPVVTRLIGNSPNPFAPHTRISFELAQAGPVRLEVFDITGRLVHRLLDRAMDAGRYQTDWDGRDSQGREMASGRYFYRLETSSRRETRSMTLLR